MTSPSLAATAQIPESPVAGTPPQVLAVLVAHDGMAWLPGALDALAAQAVQPTAVVAVDTGSRDGSRDLLRQHLGDDAVLVLPRTTGYPEAVAAGLAFARERGLPAGDWLWLLHDDAAPDPTCLAELLGYVAAHPSASLVGPKAVDWDDPRVLVEVGVSTDRSGHRATGLERNEPDQGQHDQPRDVLAVGTAGALVRRTTWEHIGGLDPCLPLFRDELDLGWRVHTRGQRVVVVPHARLRHARAATTGRRSRGAIRGRAARVDRRHALFVLLAHSSRVRLLLAFPLLVLGALVRALGYALTRQLPEAGDELSALWFVLSHPRLLWRARSQRAAARTAPPGVVRPLLASRVARLRARADAVADWIGGGAAPSGSALGEPHAAGEDADRVDVDARPAPPGLLRTLLTRRSVLLALGLAVLTLLAARSLLPVLDGVLAGGRLLPAPDGASDLWAAYLDPEVAAVGPPYLALLALLSTVLLGKPWLAVTLLLLGSVPAAGLTAYLAARQLTPSPALRLLAALTWALLPVATGAVAAGRLDAAVVQVTLPLLALVGYRAVRGPGWEQVWRAALLLALTVAFAPVLWVVAVAVLAALGLAAAVSALRARRRPQPRPALAALVVLAVPPVLFLPWLPAVIDAPGLLLHGPGRVVQDLALAEPALPAWHLLLLQPGGAGTPPVWTALGVLLAALVALVVPWRRREIAVAWLVGLVGLTVALVLARVRVEAPASGVEVPVWPGVPLQVAAAALLTAAVLAADQLPARLARTSFGWRQVTVGVLAVLVVLTPVVSALTWLPRGAAGPVDRVDAVALPAFVPAELATSPGRRALVLQPTASGALGYELVGADGARIGDADVPRRDGLAEVVADVAAGRGGDAVTALATRGIRYVALHGQAPAVTDALDAAPGLVRRAQDPVLLWEVLAPTEPRLLLDPEMADQAVNGARGPTRQLLRAAPPVPVPADGEIASGDPGRLLVLSEPTDAGWTASVDGAPLESVTAWGWAQAFAVPPEGGRLALGGPDDNAALWLAAQAAAVLVLLVLSAPKRARRTGLERADGDEQ